MTMVAETLPSCGWCITFRARPSRRTSPRPNFSLVLSTIVNKLRSSKKYDAARQLVILESFPPAGVRHNILGEPMCNKKYVGEHA